MKILRTIHSSIQVDLFQSLPENSQRIAHTSLVIHPFLVVHHILETIKGSNLMLNHQVYHRGIYSYSIVLLQDCCLEAKLLDQTYKIVLHTY